MNHPHTQMDTNIHRYVYTYTEKLLVKNNYPLYTHNKEKNQDTHSHS